MYKLQCEAITHVYIHGAAYSLALVSSAVTAQLLYKLEDDHKQ